MEKENRFIKLLMISVSENESVLLYGFSSAVNQEPYPWRQRKVCKTNRSICTAILPFDEAEKFERGLTEQGVLLIGAISFSSPELVARPAVLSNDGHMKEPGPISDFMHLTEFWNVRKEETFQKIKGALHTDGKELYREVQSLFHWAEQECGADFLRYGYRFGNFEHFQRPPAHNCFEIVTHKELGLKKTTIKKKTVFSKDLIVNCSAEHRGRWLINQTKIFPSEEDHLEFTANEPMSRVIIWIWDSENGNLIFSEDLTLMMGISINMNYSSPAYKISDPWTKKLLMSASNRSNVVMQKIESVTRSTPDRAITIRSDTANIIDTAMEEANTLFSGYRREQCCGAFIANAGKDGEINSFLKVREYIEQSSVKTVVIADPYFSVQAAAKLLTRISRTDVRIDVITCLGMTDPDTGEESDVCTACRKFLADHAGVFHNNLSVCNLRRGNKPVFHDRYLIRYHDNGKIDGFLLSNSLNAMGQAYPFVIAPMEHEVCLEVCDYINWMRDPAIQEQQKKAERIICDVLFDSDVKPALPAKITQTPTLSSVWLSPWYYEEDSKLSIPKDELPVVVSAIWNHWEDEKEDICRVLGEIGATTYPWSARDLAETIQKIDGAADAFLTKFPAIAREKEKFIRHDRKGVNSPEYMLWALLSGHAKPSRQGFHLVFEQSGHIWYSEESWLYGGYWLMLELDPASFVALLEETNSPLIFDVLAARMLFYPWSETLYLTALKADHLCVQLLCAEWIFYLIKEEKLSNDQVYELMMKLTPEVRILQTMRLLSQIAFCMRVSRKANPSVEQCGTLREWLLDTAAEDIPQCSEEKWKTAVYWLYDCEVCSYCKLYLNLAERVSDLPIKNHLLQKATKIAQMDILDCSYEKDVSELIELYLYGMSLLHGDAAEKEILGKVVDWNVFETATEPELKNYAYDRWRYAYIRAKRQMQLLYMYKNSHPQAAKVTKWIDNWEKRLLDI
jgi:hypothetical protein